MSIAGICELVLETDVERLQAFYEGLGPKGCRPKSAAARRA